MLAIDKNGGLAPQSMTDYFSDEEEAAKASTRVSGLSNVRKTSL
jgi:hypothetical protein